MKHLHSVIIAVSLLLLPAVAASDSVEVKAVAIPLSDADPSAGKADALIYRGGLVLSADDPRFGGFSALGLSADGRRMISVSDAAVSFSANLSYDEKGSLAGLSGADLGTLADLDGTPLAGKRWSDAEAMSPGVEGEIIIAFERDHRLWRYDPGATVPRVLRPPLELADMPANAGVEALTLLQDGRLLAISEGSTDERASVGWISNRGGWDVLTYVPDKGFRPTGAATLPDGDVVVLERFYTPRAGVRIKIKRIRAADITAGAEIEATLLATLAPPMNVDNFEGIEAVAAPGGKAHIYVISDDNFNRGEQRTLLMMFELPLR
jgi:hypothetical protein